MPQTFRMDTLMKAKAFYITGKSDGPEYARGDEIVLVDRKGNRRYYPLNDDTYTMTQRVVQKGLFKPNDAKAKRIGTPLYFERK